MTPAAGTRLDKAASRLLAELKGNPAQAVRKAGRLANILRARVLFRECTLGTGVAAGGKVVVHNGRRMTFGNRVSFLGGMVPSELWWWPRRRAYHRG